MVATDAVLSVSFVDASPAIVVSRPVASGLPPRRPTRADRIMSVAPIRGLAAVPVTGRVFDMFPAETFQDDVTALQPTDV